MKNRKIFKLLFMVILFCIGLDISSAKTETVNAGTVKNAVIDDVEWNYVVGTAGTASVYLRDVHKGYTYIAIPQYVDGYIVTGLEEGAFLDCDTLSEIYIPETIEYIGKEAFFMCSNLQDVYYGGTSDKWDDLKRYTGSNNEELYQAENYYFMKTVVQGVNVTSVSNNSKRLDITNSLPECYNRRTNQWGNFGELSYQWYYCKTNNTDDGIPIDGEIITAYLLNMYGSSYYYYCKITNTFHNLSVSVSSTPIKITLEPLQQFWFLCEEELDKYGNIGTEDKPYIIKNSDDFAGFMECLHMAEVNACTDFSNKYIKIKLEDEEKIDLSWAQYDKEILEFKGHMDANESLILYLNFGFDGSPIRVNEMESLKRFFLSIHNVVYKHTCIIVADMNCINEWFTWFYGDGFNELAQINSQFDDLEIGLAE